MQLFRLTTVKQKSMIRTLLCLLIFAIPALSANSIYAQEADSGHLQRNRYSFAVFAGGIGYDVGVGAEIGSPSFSNNRICVRLKGNIIWFEQYKVDFEHWAKYRSVNASIVYNFINVDRCIVFVEAGPLIILPDKRLSKKNAYQGANASVGIEMFVLNSDSFNMCYYFSTGVTYSKATADNLENHPRYGNGFVFSNGFRFYF
jgi:hypothetical protein